MNILHINKYFYKKGGAETLFFNMSDLLAEKGHQVIPFSMKSPQNEKSDYEKYFISNVDFYNSKNTFKDKLKALGRLFYSQEAKRNLKKLLNENQVDIVHLHNIYHQMPPSFLKMLKNKYKLPLLMTVHDYKLISPSYGLLNNNKVCEDCYQHKYYKAVMNKCHKNSRSSSALLALEKSWHTMTGAYNNLDLLLCPSQFMKNKLEAWGITTPKKVLANFIDLNKFKASENNGDYLLYYGRLSKEKGVDILIKSLQYLPNNICVKIVGIGKFKENLLQLTKDLKLKNKIEFVGFKSGQELYNIISQARLVVVPSVCYENSPFTILESFALAKPVIASNIGGIPELLNTEKEKYKRGKLFIPGNQEDLANQLLEIWNNDNLLKEMGRNARQYVEKYHSAENYYKQLEQIYKKYQKNNKLKKVKKI